VNGAALSGEDLRSLYRELILDHARSPRNFGKLPDATHSSEGLNPLCGDKLRLYLKLDGDEITDARFEGTGCAISVASASLLTETVVGMNSSKAISFSDGLVGRLRCGSESSAATTPPDLGKLRALEGVREFPSRVKCATLAWRALASAIQKDEAAASTE
jgi:nitrogen fixation NifU-like protein